MTDQQRATEVEQRVSVQVDEHVATVTLIRPEKHNALDVPMFQAILAAAERVAAEAGIRPSCSTGRARASAQAWTSPA
jgi:enoyl-CoA hydratase/carnithine racemase